MKQHNTVLYQNANIFSPPYIFEHGCVYWCYREILAHRETPCSTPYKRDFKRNNERIEILNMITIFFLCHPCLERVYHYFWRLLIYQCCSSQRSLIPFSATHNGQINAKITIGNLSDSEINLWKITWKSRLAENHQSRFWKSRLENNSWIRSVCMCCRRSSREIFGGSSSPINVTTFSYGHELPLIDFLMNVPPNAQWAESG